MHASAAAPRRTISLLAALLATFTLAGAATASPQTCHFPTLQRAASPASVGFSAAGLARVDQLIERDVAAGFPGAALIVIKDGQIVKQSHYGYRKKFDGRAHLDRFPPVRDDTLFDLASNTKMYATNFALQKLVSEGRLDLLASVRHYLPDFVDGDDDPIRGKAGLRVIDLLHHAAGFAPDPQFHNPAVAGSFFSQNREKTLALLPKLPLRYEPGSKTTYSDTDYMLLGLIVERITGERLDTYVENTIYRPLHLDHTLFNPLQKGFRPQDFAATEPEGNTREGTISFPHIRTYTLQGEVHDEKAYYAMGGVSGHAGLFSTTGELAVLLQVMLNGGGYGDVCLFDPGTIARFTAPSPLDPTFALGWRRNGTADMQWMFGSGAGPQAYGHTGWTGTLTVIDPEIDLGIVLLTNKKHSPLVDAEHNSNKFSGDLFATGKYGAVVAAVYAALNDDVTSAAH